MLKWKTNLAQDSDGLYNARQMINQLTQGLPLANESTVQLADTHLNESSDWSKINYNEYYLFDSLAGLNAPDKQSLIYARGLTIKIGDSNEFIQLAITQDGIGVKYNNTNWSYLLNGSGGSGTSGNYVIDNKDGTVYFNGVTVTLATSKDVQSLINLIKLKQDKLTYNPADDTKVVHTTDMRKPASEVASIDEVNNKQDAIGYKPANDTQVVHKTGDEEIAGQKTFDNAPIDKATGNPYITKDGVPSDVARTGQAQTFTQQQTFSIAPVINDASTDKGDNQAATMADLKSVEADAWHVAESSYPGLLMQVDRDDKIIYILSTGDPTTTRVLDGDGPSHFIICDLSSYIDGIVSASGYITIVENQMDVGKRYNLGFTGAKLLANANGDILLGRGGYSISGDPSVLSNTSAFLKRWIGE